MDEANKIEENHEDDSLKLEKQNARTFLRERFLRCIGSIGGSECEMKTIENTELKGRFKCMDIDVQNLLIEKLDTPSGVLKNGLVRTEDIFYIHFPKIQSYFK